MEGNDRLKGARGKYDALHFWFVQVQGRSFRGTHDDRGCSAMWCGIFEDREMGRIG
jgi:hypothetical protein